MITQDRPARHRVTNEDLPDVHLYDDDQLPWALCGELLTGGEATEADEVNCELCLEIDRRD